MRPPQKPFRGQRKDTTRINENIHVNEVRVIDQNGDMQGVMRTNDAQALADDLGLDLVEVSPNAEPPVCKILNYSKYKFELQKKASEARKKQKTSTVKEVKIRPGTEEHDYQVKIRNARKFLEKGDKVKVTMRFRGREMAHQNIGLELLRRMQEELSDISKVDLSPKREGRQMIMVLSPEVAIVP